MRSLCLIHVSVFTIAFFLIAILYFFFFSSRDYFELSWFVECKPVPPTHLINENGCYFLTKDLIVSGNEIALTISADDVELDLNNKKIIALDKTINPENNIGILCPNQKNIKIKNGRLDNFYNGIVVSNSEDVAITNTKLTNIQNVGFIVSNSNTVHIKNNRVALKSLADKKDTVDFYLIGVNIVASQNIHIDSNVIQATIPPSIDPLNAKRMLEYVGILLSSQNNKIYLENNQILLDRLPLKSYGIWSINRNNNIEIYHNSITNVWYGIVSADEGVKIKDNSFTILDHSGNWSNLDAPVDRVVYVDTEAQKVPAH